MNDGGSNSFRGSAFQAPAPVRETRADRIANLQAQGRQAGVGGLNARDLLAGVEGQQAGRGLAGNFEFDMRGLKPRLALEKRRAGVLYVNANAQLRKVMGLRFGLMSVDEAFTVETAQQALQVLDENPVVRVVVIHALSGSETECLTLHALLRQRHDTRVILAGSIPEHKLREAGVTPNEVLDPASKEFVPRIIEEIGMAKVLVKMLYVDDEPAMHAMVDAYCDGQTRVLHARDSQQALRLLEEHPDVRVIVTDVNMTYMGEGFDLLEMLAGRRNVEVLVASAGGYDDAKRERVGLREEDIIQKPFVNGNLQPLFDALKRAADTAYKQAIE